MASHEIATADEIRAIRDRALRLLGEVDRQADEDEAEGRDTPAKRQEHRRLGEIVIETLRFCTVAADALEDPSLADVVVDAVDRLDDYDDHADRHPRVAARALATLLRAGWKLDKRVRRLAKDERSEVRTAIAQGLRPDGAAERELLQVLLRDPVASVRKAARASLEALEEVPWWTGKWKSDPAARLLPGEAETCGPALRRVSEMLDLPGYTLFGKDRTKFGELCDELARLPHELAIEAGEQVCRSADGYAIRHLGPLLVQMLGRPGGVDAFDRLVEYWGRKDSGFLYTEPVEDILRACPTEARLAVCRRCIDRVLAAPRAERYEMDKSPAYVAASIVGKAWPPGEDITPVLDALLSIPDERIQEFDLDFVRGELSDALGLEGVDPTPVLDRIVEARLAGYPGPWAPIRSKVEILLGRAPRDVLRRTAEQALHSDDRADVAWAMEQLLGAAHDPAIDGSLAERVAAFTAQPRLRDIIFGSSKLMARAMPTLRAALRRGELSYPRAVKTLEAIGSLFGGLGLGDALWRVNALPSDQVDEERRKKREEVAPFLSAPDLAGPPSEADWEALRRARAASEERDPHKEAQLWVRALREGPWTPDELEVFDDLLARYRAGEAEGLEYHLGFALASKPDAAKLPIFDELLATCDKDVRPLLRHARAHAYAALGVDPTPPAAGGEAPGGPPAADNWDDDDDGP